MSKLFKYFFLILVGFAITCVASVILGGTHIVIPLLPLVGDLVVRLGIILLSLMATTIIIESLR
ncbi:MAG: hypothetical protein HC862_30460 [Scytonema sp. RU_4_4]|nr:hypothetical protein [Scytonema sp. RU_4_4]